MSNRHDASDTAALCEFARVNPSLWNKARARAMEIHRCGSCDAHYDSCDNECDILLNDTREL